MIFTSTRTEGEKDYIEMSQGMENLTKLQEGYLAVESARNEIGITVSYLERFKNHQELELPNDHLIA